MEIDIGVREQMAATLEKILEMEKGLYHQNRSGYESLDSITTTEEHGK